MQRSTERILTTHTGSLPRPSALVETLSALERGRRPDPEVFAEQVRDAVRGVVQWQVDAGIDVVNDGEASKVGYSTYVTERLSGFGGNGRMGTIQEVRDYPEWAHATGFDNVSELIVTPACVGDISYADRGPLDADIANLAAAAERSSPQDVFMSAASPGVIALFLQNQHYPTRSEYLQALGEAMKEEYDAIHAAGFVLQIDCPDLAMGRHIEFPDASLEEWRRTIAENVEALNDATRDIPPEEHAHPPLLGQLRGSPRPRRPARRHPRHRLRRAAGGDLVRGGQPAPRARVAGLRGRRAPRRQGPHPRGDRLDDELRRAPRARRPAPAGLRARRRP